MIINKFKKDSKIVRTSKHVFNDYHRYDDDLRKDFHNRCGYCGSSHDVIQSFEIDHFIPEAQFKGRDNTLKTSYRNLVYSCKKCNRTKSGKYKDGPNYLVLENIRFYDPGTVDFNHIFFRDKYGFLKSFDEKGKKMIIDLKLYNPIYGVAWIIEEIKDITLVLKEIADNESDICLQNSIMKLFVSLSCKLYCLTDFLNNNIDCQCLNKL